MSAPALVLLAQGTEDPRVEQVYHTLRHELQTERPNLSVHLAFAGAGTPTSSQVIGTLTNRGMAEIVLVPLDITCVCDVPTSMQSVLPSAHRHRPGTRIALARPIGPAIELLNVLDVRLRSALSAVHATELDGLVLSLPGWGDTRGASLVARRARQWAAHHRLPVLVAYGDGSGPDVASVIQSLRLMGRRSIAVGSMYLAPTDEYRQQAEVAMASGAVAVSTPIGADGRLCELALARYAFSAMELLEDGTQDALPSQAL